MSHETVLEIHLDHLTHNFKYLKSKLQEGVKFMAVVKAAGYGSDAVSIAKHLETLKVDYFAVAYTQEAVELRKNGITTPILILHPQPYNFQEIISNNLVPSLYNLNVLKQFMKTAEDLHLKMYPVHLKFNTGLHRIGFNSGDLDQCYQLISKTDAVTIEGILSHLAASEDVNEIEFTRTQIKMFENIVNEATNLFGSISLIHQCNTSGILNFPEAHFTMVRSGIGLYGFGNDARYDRNLKPISSLKSVISQINFLKKGESLGYNRAFIANAKTQTATIAIGHADGISRAFGKGKGYVWIHKQKAVIIGNVCMDMIMVDVTHISCKEGDEVILFDANHTAAEMAEFAGTISYELLTAISPRVKRKVVS